MPYYPNYYPQTMPQAQPTQVQQSNGFISVPSEDVARNYPVAPGNSISFKNENAPYVYTKTMGFSQFDQPIFKKYKLIEEEDAMSVKTDQDNIQLEIAKLWDEVNVLKKTMDARKEDDGV